MDAYVAMGCIPSWTCAPYQLPGRPGLGQQIAWGESNAIVFANSVLGARTERYGDFMDIACALTGRAPYYGLHTDVGRVASLAIEVDVPDSVLDDDVLYPLLGHALGQIAGTDVAYVNPHPYLLGEGYRFTGDVSLALDAERGNSETDEWDLASELTWRSLTDRPGYRHLNAIPIHDCARKLNVAFWDMTSPCHDYLASAGDIDFNRDWVHNNDYGKQIIGRVLREYFLTAK